jgi:thiol-disulfide isomerase/thioredoxin
LRTPFLNPKISSYLEKLTVQHPDSINLAIDRVLNLLKPSEESFRYYLSHLLNSYARSKVVGFDAVYVHIVENYYGKGLAPWVDEENLAKMVSEARLTKPLLIGKKAPDFTSFMEDGTPVTLSEIESDYVVLVFWAPDCGHCKKAMPFVIEFAEKFKDRGVQVISLCNKAGDKTITCWDGIKEEKMESLLNLADDKDRSRLKYKYYVKSTPKIFILDRNQEILIKKIGAEQLESVMDEIIEFRNKQVGEIK